MKLLMYRYGSICEPDIIATFQEFGMEVIEYSREVTVKDDKPSESVKLLSEFMADHPVDFVFSINFFPFVSELCQVFHIRYLSWIVDAPVMELYATSITNSYNRVFLFDRALYDEISPLNPDCVFHLPLAARTAPKDQLFAAAPQKTIDKFSHQVAFVGSLYTEKCPYDKLRNAPAHLTGYLDGIMKAQEQVYGYYFIEDLLTDEIVEEFRKYHPSFYHFPGESYLTDKRTLAQLYIGNKISAMERVDTFTALSERFDVSIYTGSDTSMMPGIHNMGFARTLDEMPLIFNNSKINLNITSKAIRTGLPLRIFDVLSAGGFLISNYQAEIPECLTPGEDLVMYSDQEELQYLIEYYLNHEDERAAIAECGNATLKNKYTYELQLGKLMLQAFGQE